MTRLFDARVGAGGAAGQDVGLVLHGAGAGEERPVVAALRGPARGDDEDLGALVDQGAEELGEAQVVAGGQAQRRLRQPYGDRFGARAHHDGLALVEAEAVDLAVGAHEIARGREDQGGVVERALGVPFADRAGVQPDARVPRGVRHGLGRGSVQRLRLGGEGLVGEGPDRPELGQHHQIAAALCAHELRDAGTAGGHGLFGVHCRLDQRGAHGTTTLSFARVFPRVKNSAGPTLRSVT
ncbi:hypothetical protein GCM10020000_41280 [Streptomyces olivoverticillatus]